MSKAIKTAKKFFRLFQSAQISSLAASLAFHSLLSFIPLLTLGVWYLSSAGITEFWIQQARDYLLSHLNVGEGHNIVNIFNRITENAGASSWGWVGLVIFLYTSLNLLLSVGNAIDFILKAKEVELSLNRGAIQTWARRLIFLIVLPSFLGASSALMAWLKDDSWLTAIFQIETVGVWLAQPLPWCIDYFAFFLLYYYVPNSKISPRQAARAALFATPLFILGKFGMSYYSSYALTTQKIYGAFAIVPIIMLWVYWAWMIVLGGVLLIKRSPTHDLKLDKA